jgi:hypothetical protein
VQQLSPLGVGLAGQPVSEEGFEFDGIATQDRVVDLDVEVASGRSDAPPPPGQGPAGS